MKWNKAAGVLLALFFWGGLVSVASADWADDFFGAKPDDFIKSRSYVGGVATSCNIDQWGDFNGVNGMTFIPSSSSTISGATVTPHPEADFIPAITRNFGWGVLVGQREGPWAVEASYWRSEHVATWTGGTSSTYYEPSALQSVDFNFKRYFFTQVPTQPFFYFGLSIPWLWVRQGSLIYQDSTYANVIGVNDETIQGIGLNIGVGMEIYLGNGFSLIGGASRRWTSWDQINGAEKIPLNNMYFDGNPSDRGSLAGDGFNFYVGTTVGME